jgi:hypothetical protein
VLWKGRQSWRFYDLILLGFIAGEVNLADVVDQSK